MQHLLTCSLLLALACMPAIAARAQWDPVGRAGWLRQLDPHVRTADQVQLYASVASTWMLSAKARPYLDHADSLLRELEAAGDRSQQTRLAVLRVNLLYMEAYQAKFRRDIPQALAMFGEAVLIQEGLGFDANRIHDAIGTLYRSVEEPELAVEAFRKGLASEKNDPQGRWALHIGMAGALADMGRSEEAAKWLLPCDTAVAGVLPMLRCEQARIAVLKGDSLGGIRLYGQVASGCGTAPDEWCRVAPLTAMAKLQLAGRKWTDARALADSCAAVALRTGDEAAWCTCMILGGQARLASGEKRMAERLLRSALDTARHYGYIGLARLSGEDGSMVRAAELLKDLYLADGRLPEALRMTSYWSMLKDTLNRRDGRLEVLRAEMHREAFADSLEQARITAEERRLLDGQLATERLRRAYVVAGSIAAACILVLIAYLLARRLQQARRLARQERALYAKEVDELLHKQEIAAMHAMFEGQEKERDRVARDLHDRVGSMLGNVKMQMEVLEDRMDTDHQERVGQYRKVYGLLVETVGEVRRISHDMVAGTLARFGLEKALEGLCDSVRISGHLAVECHCFGLGERLERGVEIAVYRIVQELVGNVLKHAKATELVVDVTRTPDRLSVIVSDNGVGFDPHAATEGIGLTNVRKRAATIGGELSVDSTPGKGTTVSLECALGK